MPDTPSITRGEGGPVMIQAPFQTALLVLSCLIFSETPSVFFFPFPSCILLLAEILIVKAEPRFYDQCWRGSKRASPATRIDAYIITEASSLSLLLTFRCGGRYCAAIQMTDCERAIKIKINEGNIYPTTHRCDHFWDSENDRPPGESR